MELGWEQLVDIWLKTAGILIYRTNWTTAFEISNSRKVLERLSFTYFTTTEILDVTADIDLSRWHRPGRFCGLTVGDLVTV